MNESKLRAWYSALDREELAVKNVRAARKLFESGGPDLEKNWSSCTAAHDALESARKAERGAFLKLQAHAEQAGLKLPDESDAEEEAAGDGADEKSGHRGRGATAGH